MNSLELIIIIIIIILVIFLLYKKNINRNEIENLSTDTSANNHFFNNITITGDSISFNKKITFNGNIEIPNNNFTKNTLDIFPPDTILLFYGLETSVPPGWAICNGKNDTPDFSGRFLLGSGKGTDLTERPVNQRGGEETHKLTLAEMPSHSHTNTMRMGKYRSRGGQLLIWGFNEGEVWPYDIHMNNVGDNKAHNNMPPFHVLHFIMKMR
jgi:hypothetical protein